MGDILPPLCQLWQEAHKAETQFSGEAPGIEAAAVLSRGPQLLNALLLPAGVAMLYAGCIPHSSASGTQRD